MGSLCPLGVREITSETDLAAFLPRRPRGLWLGPRPGRREASPAPVGVGGASWARGEASGAGTAHLGRSWGPARRRHGGRGAQGGLPGEEGECSPKLPDSNEGCPDVLGKLCYPKAQALGQARQIGV